jgi:hypothetical protein
MQHGSGSITANSPFGGLSPAGHCGQQSLCQKPRHCRFSSSIAESKLENVAADEELEIFKQITAL